MLPTGMQYLLADDRQEAVVCEVGATLRRYEADHRPVCWGFSEDEMSSGGRGQILAPWPNRLEDGEYVYAGVTARAGLDEPERANAIHGLVRWLPWRMERLSEASVRGTCLLHPQPGYPFSIAVVVEYELVEEGLVARTSAENLGGASAPFGLGFHNYLHAGDGRVDRCRLRLPARQHVVVDERLLPQGREAVEGGPFAGVCGVEPGEIGTLVIDDCFTGLEADDDGRWRARFLPAGGEADAVTLWADARFAWAQVYSGDTLEAGQRRGALAVEPMTCPANALRSGEGLVVLEPGETFAAAWGLAPERLRA